MESFIERLERLLKNSHMTQAYLADSVGLRRTTISDWKKNGSYPSADVAVKIADILGTTVEYLVAGRGGEKSSYKAKYDELADEVRRIAEKIG